MGKKSELKRNVILSMICKPVSMLLSYLYVPMVLNYLGIEKYGIWSTILTILSWISYCDIGIGNGLRNRLTEAVNNKKTDAARKLIASSYVMISLVMIVVTIIFCTVSVFINWKKVFGINDIDENLTGVICISVVFLTVNFVISICKNILYALQKASTVSIMDLCVQVINIIGVLTISALDSRSGNLFLISLIYGISMLIVNLLFSIRLFTQKTEIFPHREDIDLKIGMDLTNLGIKFFIIQICALVLFTTDSLIISILYGAANVTPYSMVNKLFNILVNLYGASLMPVWSAVTKAKVEKDYMWIKKLLKKYYLLMVPFFIGIILLSCVFRSVSNIWLNQELDYSFSLIFFGAAYSIIMMWCNTFANVMNGLELMKISIIIAIAEAVVNLPLSLFFAEVLHMGSAGILAGTVCSLLISAIANPIAVHKTICIKQK